MEQMEQKQRQKQDIEFDLRKLCSALWKKLPWIILCGALAAAGTGAAETWLIPPVYESSTKMYILSAQADMGIASADFQSSTLLTKDYAELIQSRDVTEEVIEELGLEESHEDLLGKMDVSIPADTRIIKLSVRDTDPERAREVVEAVRDTAAEHINDVIQMDAVSTAEKANTPIHPVEPKRGRDTAAAGMIGAAAGALAFAILYLRDDRLRTREDIQEVLGLSTLGAVPLEENDDRRNRRKRLWHRS